jgi:hypothetical protein
MFQRNIQNIQLLNAPEEHLIGSPLADTEEHGFGHIVDALVSKFDSGGYSVAARMLEANGILHLEIRQLAQNSEVGTIKSSVLAASSIVA